MANCPVCGKRRSRATRDYDYTKPAGLDPARYEIVLKDIRVSKCACGEAATIPNIDGLHFMIGMSIVCDQAPLYGSGAKFIRKTLGLTQKEFADRIGITDVYLSQWEREETLPKKPTRVLAALHFASAFLAREEFRPVLGVDAVREVIDSFLRRTREFTNSIQVKSELSVDTAATPPAWQIDAFSGVGSLLHANRR